MEKNLSTLFSTALVSGDYFFLPLAGAAVVTDESIYMRKEFRDGEELVMFPLKELATLPDRVCSLFGHLDEAQQMANRGYLAVKSNHTWKNRAEYIREFILFS